ncbi:MAG: glycerol-3-phosphate dehydrogenase/oxidase, partial [Desulfosalsimonadaceae bacterium]
MDPAYDLLVIGGGITGAGVFREAVRMGLKTLLCEARDFAWGTSSRSSKLIHGGLRYLKEGKILLTREAVRERQRLLREAPALIEPIGFMMPVYRHRSPGRLSMHAGLALYDLMAGEKQHKYYGRNEFALRLPGIAEKGLRGGFRFMDAQADDARLVLRLIAEASAEGGTAINYTRAAHILRHNSGAVRGAGLEDTETGETREIAAKAVINATGAWAEKLHPSPKPHLHLRPLRGSHLVFPRWLLPINQAVTLMHPEDGRPLFIIPWEGALILGTTDLDHGPEICEEPVITEAEAEYMMQALNASFPSLKLRAEDATASWAGIRPVLSRGNKAPSRESREYIVWQNQGLITVTGGKLTTFRCLAKDAINTAKPFLPGTGRVQTQAPAFSPILQNKKKVSRLYPGQIRRLYGRYGALADQMLEHAETEDLTAMPGTNTLWAELPVVAKTGNIRHLSDLLLRRVRIGLLMKEGGKQHMDRIQKLCAPILCWDEERWKKEREDYIRHREHAYPAPPRPPGT